MSQHNTPAANADAGQFQTSFNEAAAQKTDGESKNTPDTAPAASGQDLNTLLATERSEREKLEALLRKEREAAKQNAATRSKAPDSSRSPRPDAQADERLIRSFLDANPDMEAPLCALVRREAIQAIRPLAEALMAEQHIQRIAQAHPDWSSLAKSDELTCWIDEQPPYIAKSLHQVVAGGHADDVIDLLTRFKAELKAKATADNDAQGKDSATANALAVPARGSGLPKSAPDTEDFRSAWREAVSRRE